MAQLDEQFDPDTVEPRDNFDPLPAGKYLCEVIGSDIVDTKNGSGRIIKLTLKVTDGEYAGRQVWDNINYKNASEVAQKIGQQQLAEICTACGISGPLDDTERLHGTPIVVTLAIDNKNKEYLPKNVVKRYAAVDAPAPAAHVAPARQATAAPATTATRPAAARPAVAVAAAAGGRPWNK